VGVDAVPERDGDTEEPLPRHEPVAVEPFDPRLVARPHVLGMPLQLPTPIQQRLAQVFVTTTVLDVPLPRRDDLERALTALVELDRVRHGPRLADEITLAPKELNDFLTRRLDGLAGERVPVRERVAVPVRDRRRPVEAAVPSDDRPRRQLELAPPRDVRDVSARADRKSTRLNSSHQII